MLHTVQYDEPRPTKALRVQTHQGTSMNLGAQLEVPLALSKGEINSMYAVFAGCNKFEILFNVGCCTYKTINVEWNNLEQEDSYYITFEEILPGNTQAPL